MEQYHISQNRKGNKTMATAVFSRKELLKWLHSSDDFGLRCRIQHVLDCMGADRQANIEITVTQELYGYQDNLHGKLA